MSWPCRQSPASRRRLSRAASPIHMTRSSASSPATSVRRFGCRQADLEAVLAGIAGAAHEPAGLRLRACHEGQGAATRHAGLGRHRPGIGPCSARNTRSSGSTPTSKTCRQRASGGRRRRGVAGVGDDHEARRPSFVTIRSSRMPACSLSRKVYFDCPGSSASASSGQARSSNSPACGTFDRRRASCARCRTGRHARGYEGAPSSRRPGR
jgi:hypothetical protein